MLRQSCSGLQWIYGATHVPIWCEWCVLWWVVSTPRINHIGCPKVVNARLFLVSYRRWRGGAGAGAAAGGDINVWNIFFCSYMYVYVVVHAACCNARQAYTFSCLLDKSPHLANRNKSVIVCVQVYAFITNFLGLRLHTIQFSKSILYIWYHHVTEIKLIKLADKPTTPATTQIKIGPFFCFWWLKTLLTSWKPCDSIL